MLEGIYELFAAFCMTAERFADTDHCTGTTATTVATQETHAQLRFAPRVSVAFVKRGPDNTLQVLVEQQLGQQTLPAVAVRTDSKSNYTSHTSHAISAVSVLFVSS